MPDLVSVIVPAYNAELTLQKCICSLLEQTYEPLEIIIIDDGSKDNTKIFGETLAEEHAKIIFECQSNSGVSAARNKGLQLARGEWIAFCDSDDFVDKTYIELMIENQKKYSSDWVIAGYKKVVNGREYVFATPYKEDITYDKIRPFIAEWYKNSYIAGVCGALYSSKLIRDNHICFPEGIHHGEDTIFNIRYIRNCKHISILCSPIYTYVDQKESLTKVWNENIWKNQEVIFSEFQNLCIEKKYEKRIIESFFIRGVTISLNYASTHHSNKKNWEKLCKQIQSHLIFKEMDIATIKLDPFAKFIIKELKKNHIEGLRKLFQLKLFMYTYMNRIYYLIRR